MKRIRAFWLLPRISNHEFAWIHTQEFTERDEFAYHEMLCHLPLFSHPNPRRVLIVGGGDGGVLREVCRHSCVEKITIVEIDPEVIAVCKEFFGTVTATSFEDPRVEIVNADGAEYMKNAESETYDIIIADSSDPLGPAESLFQPEFYESMHRALREGGIICCQGECMWIHLDLISDVLACCADIFDYAEYATTMVPTYPCGQIGFILARKGWGGSCDVPRRRPAFLSELRWYNPEIHQAAFVLPEFVRQRLEPLNRDNVDGEETDRCFLACAIS